MKLKPPAGIHIFAICVASAGNSLAYDARAHSGLVGFDRLFGERLLLGMSGGYSRGSADTLYNGVIAYAAMGVLFALEWLIRQRVRGRS